MPLDPEEQPLLCTRGLVLDHTRRGALLSETDVSRWLRVNSLAYRTTKVDLLLHDESHRLSPHIQRTAKELQLALSLRTRCMVPPPPAAELNALGLHDLLLTPASISENNFKAWLAAAHAAELPVRVQLHAPYAGDVAPADLAAELHSAGVVAVTLGLEDPFARPSEPKTQPHPDGASMLAYLHEFAAATEKLGIEANITDVPFCLLPEEDWVHCKNSAQRAVDHQFYAPASHTLAVQLFNRRSFVVRQVLLALLARHTHVKNPADEVWLPWLLRGQYGPLILRLRRRLMRPIFKYTGWQPPTEQEKYKKAVESFRLKTRESYGPVCGECRLRRICDRATPAVRRWLPEHRLRPQEGTTVLAPDHFSRRQTRYYDPLDRRRLKAQEHTAELAQQAKDLVFNHLPDHYVSPFDYALENAAYESHEGVLRWYGLRDGIRTSTPLARLEPPFSVGVDFGGGYAEYAGFAMGRRCVIVCPMEAYRHSLLLHVDARGEFVLLRDGEPVTPLEFPGLYLPATIAGVVEPRLCLINIEDTIASSNVRYWKSAAEAPPNPSPTDVRYSVLITSTRFTRRLQAVLRCLAKQQDFPLDRIEVIVAYVPGIDATDDLLDGVNAVYPELRIVRSPFDESKMRAKGFMINESLPMAAGEWIVLLDADTLLPPRFFAVLDSVADTAEWVAPDGRKLLSPEMTAKILLGEIDPQEQWEELLNTAGEFRHREASGIPIGFCQCVRKKYLDSFPYTELQNFEWADMEFGLRMRYNIGQEHRLSGYPVLHLDHGGSQWFGTAKHF